MKLIIDERLKHRLIGLAVIVSIGTIFAPALIKKSSHRFDETISIQLPPKPIAPKLSLPEKQQVFQTIKVAHVEIPDIPKETKALANTQVKAESISTLNELKSTIVTATKQQIKPTNQLAIVQKNKIADVTGGGISKKSSTSYILPIQKSKDTTTKTSTARTVAASSQAHRYAVQLGTFLQEKNAIALVNKLKSKGYLASYNKVNSKNGVAYRVIVGQVNQKQQAILLQQRLASAMQLQGFIVTTRMS